MIAEKWLDVPEYKGLYAVSDQGRVKRVSLGANGASKIGRILKPRPMKSGYLRVGLGKNGQIKDMLIHRLVLLAFSQNINVNNLQVNHLNGDKSDNNLVNLKWVTQSENVIHAYQELNHRARGETNHMTTLTTEDVLAIRKMANDGVIHRIIAEQFGVTRRSIGRIVNRERWQHV